MNRIICNYDLNKKQFDFISEVDAINCYSLEISFRFSNGESVVTFKNLSFGYDISQDGDTKYGGQYPRNGQIYESTDQQNLETVTVDVLPGRQYRLSVWCEEQEIRTDAVFDITINNPPQPYPSWIWSETRWIPPIPYPTTITGSVYYWNESKRNWSVLDQLVDTSGYEVT